MKCPHCHEETNRGGVCERCGDALPPQKDVQVEYKEFTVTELLDIRMAKKDVDAGTGKKDGKTAPPDRDFRKPVNVARKQANSAKKKSFIVLITVIVIVIAAIIAFYLRG